MKKYTYEITIEASSESAADQKMNALTVLARFLTEKELNKLAWIVEHDPQKKALAKQALGV